MRMAMVGLGKMGGNMVRRLCRGNIEVVGFDRSTEVVAQIAREAGMIAANSVEDAVSKLSSPRIVWLMLPSGDPTEQQIQALAPLLDKGDIIVDGGNSNYHDSQRRGVWLAERGIGYMDSGTSGGIWGLENGYCLMVGASGEVAKIMTPILQALAPAADRGWAHVGPVGAGHFTKMIHNGIEYGMMQAYGEGFQLLEASPYAETFNYAEVAHLWNQGSVVRSWLLELAESAFSKDHKLKDIQGIVEDSGEGRWTVDQAIESGVSAPVIALALMARFRSKEKDAFSDKLVAALRREFGGHAVVGTGKGD